MLIAIHVPTQGLSSLDRFDTLVSHDSQTPHPVPDGYGNTQAPAMPDYATNSAAASTSVDIRSVRALMEDLAFAKKELYAHNLEAGRCFGAPLAGKKIVREPIPRHQPSPVSKNIYPLKASLAGHRCAAMNADDDKKSMEVPEGIAKEPEKQTREGERMLEDRERKVEQREYNMGLQEQAQIAREEDLAGWKRRLEVEELRTTNRKQRMDARKKEMMDQVESVRMRHLVKLGATIRQLQRLKPRFD